MNLKSKRKFWSTFIKLKKILRVTAEVSSFVLLLMSFEKALVLKTWSAIKPWQVARLLSKLPRLVQTFSWAFSAA